MKAALQTLRPQTLSYSERRRRRYRLAAKGGGGSQTATDENGAAGCLPASNKRSICEQVKI